MPIHFMEKCQNQSAKSSDLNLATNMIKNTVDISINKKRTNALVDTGVSITVVSALFLNKTSYANAVLMKPDFYFVNGFGGRLNVLVNFTSPCHFKVLHSISLCMLLKSCHIL